MRLRYRAIFAFCLGISFPSVAGLTEAEKAKLPPAVSERVNFLRDIKPLLETSCTKCHGRGKHKGDFSINDRAAFLKGGESGPAAVAGKSSESYVIELVSATDADTIMPKKGSKLTPRQIGLLRAWIDQGLPWDSKVTFAKIPPVNMSPRRPSISVPPSANGIDVVLKTYLKTNQVGTEKLVDDRTFARRVYLDTIGLIPPPADLEAFLASGQPDKRLRLVRRLLSDNHGYAQHWMTFWNDALRNDYRGTGYIDGGRKQISSWLYRSLVNNTPYDRFVGELVNPNSESEGFVKGIVWRGVVNASQVPPMQAAQNISQVFMGVNLKCASCHDSFINDWTLADAYSLANIYASEPLELFQCDKPTGEKAALRFLFPELGAIPASTNRQERLRELASVMTSKKNGRLSRTMVNRLWARLMGRGLVEPVDEMDAAAWNSDLLDWLAEDFVAHGYDVKKTLERIMTSRAYQLPPVTSEDKVFVFRGPAVRRMSAEQFRDALASVTGEGYAAPAADVDLTIGKNPSALPVRAKWIWSHADAREKARPETLRFEKSFLASRKPAEAHLLITCDNSFVAYLNGEKIGSGKELSRLSSFNVRGKVRAGTNLLSVIATNDPKTKDAVGVDAENPAGLLVYLRLRATRRVGEFPVETVMDLASDASWVWSAKAPAASDPAVGGEGEFSPAVELGDPDAAPWQLGSRLAESVAAAALGGKVRSALVAADPLLVALGRPNREQVVTSRPTQATTLQALELTNGETLMRLLEGGANRWLQESAGNPRTLVQRVYSESLGRLPSGDEMRLGEELVGSPVQKSGLEDFLWLMVMLPEFQLIY